MFETFNVPVGAVVRLRRHRRLHGWSPQLLAIDITLPALRRRRGNKGVLWTPS